MGVVAHQVGVDGDARQVRRVDLDFRDLAPVETFAHRDGNETAPPPDFAQHAGPLGPGESDQPVEHVERPVDIARLFGDQQHAIALAVDRERGGEPVEDASARGCDEGAC